MTTLSIAIAFTIFSACSTNNISGTDTKVNNTPTMETQQTTPTAHAFTLPAIDGSTINLASYKGKKMLIVNTASECGFTRQYEGLENLYKKYGDKLVIVGVPANNFGEQEPGSNEDIQSFCKKNFGVTFPLTAKMDVTGDNRNPLFAWLTSKEQNGVLDATIQWNFNKFLLDEEGKLLAYFPSKTEPESEEIVKYLQ